jgi:hypothetical protein
MCTIAIASSTVTPCSPAACRSRSERPRHGRISAPPVHQVTAVELGAHLHGQVAVAQRLEGARQVRCGQREVAAQRHEHLHLAALHRLDQRVDVHQRRAAPVGLGQPGHHSAPSVPMGR